MCKGHRGAALPCPGSGLQNLKEVKFRIKTFISVFFVCFSTIDHN